MEIERLLGKLEEAVKQSEDRLIRIEDKVDEIMRFRWAFIGGSAVFTFVVTLGVEFVHLWH